MKFIEKYFSAIAILIIAFYVSLLGAIIYVAAHFIQKFW